MSRKTHTRKNRKDPNQKKLSASAESLLAGIGLIRSSPLFGGLDGEIIPQSKQRLGAKTPAVVDSQGHIYVNQDIFLPAKQWLYIIAHCLLHLAFGHFDAVNMPSYEKQLSDGTTKRTVSFQPFLWNEACDIYVDRFLADLKAGEPLMDLRTFPLPGNLKTELQLYEYLTEHHAGANIQYFGTAAPDQCDMSGLSHPLTYDTANGEYNHFASCFACHLAECVSDAVTTSGGHEKQHFSNTPAAKAARWFIDHYPLLGGIASHFRIIEDYRCCYQNEIRIAAIDVSSQEIYINPACKYSQNQWRFVLAHEYLHAGLKHNERSIGRNAYLWNIACDFVINGWLHEMQLGEMPTDGLLYDEGLRGMSAESVYDRILSDMRKYKNLDTFHGNGHGDILDTGGPSKDGSLSKYRTGAVSLDDFLQEALQQGLEFHQSHNRGFLPAGLTEEIRALSMPVIPWDVQLAEWFDLHFAPLEKHRTYARPSRRQASSPDIPRPLYVPAEILEHSRTFGVIIDTSGSMEPKQLGMALGSIASYAAAKEVPYARVVFCDAAAYDAGYLSVEDIAGRVQVKGRGGTVLQPAVRLLEQAEDFPKNGPILIITDGFIESSLSVKQEHAYLLPSGNRLPFTTRSPIFYFKPS